MIAMTMMVRDEADIVGAMIQYHLDQGIDLFLVTDNGSIDGTSEILKSFASAGKIELAHDPRHLKQQHEVVTRMSREAARRGAQWVLNADADEFWTAKTPGRTIREELKAIDPALRAFDVPVIDMIGEPASSGSGLQRLVYRDTRPDKLMQELGIHAHATHDVAFVPTEDVDVAQGNHFVNIEAAGSLSEDRGLFVYHFPWRSWTQFERKVDNAGRAYEASPELQPSVNHHGMRDYRRLKDGLLLGSYIARHPGPDQLAEGIDRGWFVEDRHIADSVESPVADDPLDPSVVEAEGSLVRRLRPVERRLERLEHERKDALDQLEFELRHVRELDELVERLRAEIGALAHSREQLHAELSSKEEELAMMRRSQLIRAAERISRWRWLHGVERSGG